jgi:hypothetical protein
VAPNGTFAVVWSDGAVVFVRRYEASGAPLGAEIKVSTSTAGWGGVHKDLEFDTQGNFVVSWSGPAEGDDDSSGVSARRFDASGVALDEVPFRVNTYTTGPQDWPSIAMGAGGTFMIVWHGRIGSGEGDRGVFGQRFDAGGQPLGTEFRVNSATTAIAEHPSVAADALGNFMVVWAYWEPRYEVFARRYDAFGVAQGGEFRLESNTTVSEYDPSIACCDPNGNFVAVWESVPGSIFPTAIAAQRYGADGSPFGAEFQVGSYTAILRAPSASFAEDGSLTVAWMTDSDQDGSDWGIFGRHYDPSGNAAGGAFQVNTYTTLLQEFPSVAAGAGGRFVVTWSDWHRGAVFAQRFGPDLIFGDGFDQ